MKIFGRIHLDAWSFADSDRGANAFETGDADVDPRNNIEFRRARIGVSGDIDDGMFYKIELEFGHPDEFSFKDLEFGWKDLPVVDMLTIGNQKRPLGLDHLNSSRYNVFMERPFVVEAFNEDARRLGVLASGVTEDEAWNWRYGVFNLPNWSLAGEYVSDTLQPQIAGRLANTAWWDEASEGRSYAHWAVSGSVAWPDGSSNAADAPNEARFRTRPEARSQSRWIDTGRIAGADRFYIVGLEGVVNLDPVQLVGEYLNGWVDRGGMSTLHFHGGYVYASYFLTGEYMPWQREEGDLTRPKPARNLGKDGWGAWQVAARYSYADFTDDDIAGGVGEAITLGLNWYWNPNASVQVDYSNGRISDRNVVVGSETFARGDYDIVGVRFRVDF